MLSGVASCDDMRVASIGGGSVVARLGVGRSELESQREREQRERERARGMRARVDRRGGREKREERDEEREKAEESRERGPRGDRAREIEDRVNEREKRLERVQGEQKQTNRAMRRRRDLEFLTLVGTEEVTGSVPLTVTGPETLLLKDSCVSGFVCFMVPKPDLSLRE
ncbi:hypothetical protein Tco_1427671 [Tanacetum coccineum]